MFLLSNFYYIISQSSSYNISFTIKSLILVATFSIVATIGISTHDGFFEICLLPVKSGSGILYTNFLIVTADTYRDFIAQWSPSIKTAADIHWKIILIGGWSSKKGRFKCSKKCCCQKKRSLLRDGLLREESLQRGTTV